MTIAEQISRAKADYDAVYEAGKKSVLQELTFTDVESSTYRITVPNGASPFARVNKIGGMTYKCKNLFEYPYADTTVTSRGITFTDNGDGSVTLNGTNSGEGNSVFYLYSDKKPVNLPAGTYRASLANYDRNAITIIANCDGNYISIKHTPLTVDKNTSVIMYVQVSNGDTTVFNNVTVYPMLNEGGTALPYEPYFKGLRSAKVTELESEGANLAGSISPHSNTSITDGVVTQTNPDSSTDVVLMWQQWNDDELVSYHWFEYSASMIGVYSATFTKDEKSNSLIFGVNGDTKNTDVVIDISNLPVGEYTISANFTNLTQGFISWKDIMLNKGNTAVPYKPYVGTLDTLAIPEAVKSLEGYGLGVDAEYYNYIDFEHRVFVQRTRRVVFDGTEEWLAGDTGIEGKWRVRVSLPDANVQFTDTGTKSKLVCNKYKTTTAGGTWMNVQGVANHDNALWIYDENYTDQDVSLWKSHLAELYASGNPLTVDYALATPVETDISALLTDEYIEVEGGGTISAVNEYSYDAPTNISYLIDRQGG